MSNVSVNYTDIFKNKAQTLSSGDILLGGNISSKDYGVGSGGNTYKGEKLKCTLYSSTPSFKGLIVEAFAFCSYDYPNPMYPMVSNYVIITDAPLNTTTSKVKYYISWGDSPNIDEDDDWGDWGPDLKLTLIANYNNKLYAYRLTESDSENSPQFGGFGGLVKLAPTESMYVSMQSLTFQGAVASFYTDTANIYDPDPTNTTWGWPDSGSREAGAAIFEKGYIYKNDEWVEYEVTSFNSLFEAVNSCFSNPIADSKTYIKNNAYEIWESNSKRNFQVGHYTYVDTPTSPFLNPPDVPNEVVAVFRDAENPTDQWALLHSHQLIFQGADYAGKFSPMTVKLMNRNENDIFSLMQSDLIKVQDENGNSTVLRPGYVKINGSDLIQSGTNDIGAGADLTTGCVYLVYTE